MNVEIPALFVGFDAIRQGYAFWILVIMAVSISMCIYLLLVWYMTGPGQFVNRQSKDTLREVSYMNKIFHEMPAIENALQMISQTNEGHMPLSEFQQLLAQDGMTLQESEYFFKIIDHSNARRQSEGIDVNKIRASLKPPVSGPGSDLCI